MLERILAECAQCYRWDIQRRSYFQFPMRVIFITLKTEESDRNMLFQSQNLNLSQRLGSCPLPSFLLWWPTQSLPLSSTSKAKEENLEVARGKCWRGFLLSALNVTGEIFNQFPNECYISNYQNWRIRQEYVVPKPKFKFISETWILPFAVLFAMVAYAVLAIIFYKFDSWFQFNCVYDKLWYQHYFNYKSKKF